MVSGGMKCIKYLLFLFNLVIFVLGLALIGIGVTVQAKSKDLAEFLGGEVTSSAVFLIVIGFFVVIITFFGCCGAYKENHCMIITFSVLLAAVFILEIAAAIAAFLLRDQVKTLVVTQVAVSLQNYDHAGVAASWEAMQSGMKCCGANHYTDWMNVTIFSGNSVPDSCCIEQAVGCGQGVLANHNVTGIFDTGCTDVLLKWGQRNVYILGAIALSVAIIQILGVLISCCLAASVRREYSQLK
jgi:CD63 antigen